MPIDPPVATLADLQTKQFGLDSKVPATWSINPGRGTIDVNGGPYIAPGQITAAEDIIVTAAPHGGAATSVAVVRLQPRVTIIPAKVSLKAGESQRFEATDLGDPTKAVTWVISPGMGEMEAGLYKAPGTVKDPGVVIVTAKSAADQTKAASATVNLVPSQPLWVWVLTVGVYLTGLFLLAWPLLFSWPPPPADRTAFDQATVASTTAESVAKTKELAAELALETAQKSGGAAKNAPEGSPLKAQAAKDQSAADQAAKEMADAQTTWQEKVAGKGPKPKNSPNSRMTPLKSFGSGDARCRPDATCPAGRRTGRLDPRGQIVRGLRWQSDVSRELDTLAFTAPALGLRTGAGFLFVRSRGLLYDRNQGHRRQPLWDYRRRWPGGLVFQTGDQQAVGGIRYLVQN